MPSLRQLEFAFHTVDPLTSILSLRERRTTKSPGEGEVVGRAHRLPARQTTTEAVALRLRGRDATLETEARELLCSLGEKRIATQLRVEWNPRFKTAAGRADYPEKRILLNPRLVEYPGEIDRTLRHELAHILAESRKKSRRRILSHGPEWQQACRDLGIAGEKRCHTLEFPAKRHAPRFIYRCPNCRQDFPRVRKIKRTVACLACCRAHNGGEFDARFRLKLLTWREPPRLP